MASLDAFEICCYAARAGLVKARCHDAMGPFRLFRVTVLTLLIGCVLVVGGRSAASPGTTERVSVDSAGIEGNGDSGGPTLDVASLSIRALRLCRAGARTYSSATARRGPRSE